MENRKVISDPFHIKPKYITGNRDGIEKDHPRFIVKDKKKIHKKITVMLKLKIYVII